MSRVTVTRRHLTHLARNHAARIIETVRRTGHKIKRIVRELRIVEHIQEGFRVTGKDRVLFVRDQGRHRLARHADGTGITHLGTVRMIAVNAQGPRFHAVAGRDLIGFGINEPVRNIKRVPGTGHVKDRLRVPVRARFHVPDEGFADVDAADRVGVVRNLDLLHIVVMNLPLDRVPVRGTRDLPVHGRQAVGLPFKIPVRNLRRKTMGPRLRPGHGVRPFDLPGIHPEKQLTHGMRAVIRHFVMRDVLRLRKIDLPRFRAVLDHKILRANERTFPINIQRNLPVEKKPEIAVKGPRVAPRHGKGFPARDRDSSEPDQLGPDRGIRDLLLMRVCQKIRDHVARDRPRHLLVAARHGITLGTEDPVLFRSIEPELPRPREREILTEKLLKLIPRKVPEKRVPERAFIPTHRARHPPRFAERHLPGFDPLDEFEVLRTRQRAVTVHVILDRVTLQTREKTASVSALVTPLNRE
ncbi:MAG: hypothetical protein BWY49_00528 [Candidatus Omnitrophica bacterium ADurb.Bin314]|nr:MAG: hypothetical protein BWY49_00528 [Candidatus Omnitrophica bacterium ADurb.Bin314]